MSTEQVETTIQVVAYPDGEHLGRVEGFRMIVEAMSGWMEHVDMVPLGMGTRTQWRISIDVCIPPDREQRLREIVAKHFDAPADMHVTGTRTTA